MFRVVHEGNVILEIDKQVLSVTMRTARGSGPPTFLAESDGVIELVIEKVPTGGPLRLDQLEAAQIQAIRDRQTEGEPVGIDTNTLNGDDARLLATPQGARTDTLGEGVGRNETPAFGGFPGKDLGVSSSEETDEDERVKKNTAAIKEFSFGSGNAVGGTDSTDKQGQTDPPKTTNKNDGTPPDAGIGQAKGSTVPEDHDHETKNVPRKASSKKSDDNLNL